MSLSAFYYVWRLSLSMSLFQLIMPLPGLVVYLNFALTQPSKLKFLLGYHFATNSFSLGETFTKLIKLPASKFYVPWGPKWS